MEDYDTFVQRCASRLNNSEEEHRKLSPPSSVIRFYGQPVLPPLLSGERREEMMRHRDAAQKIVVQRRLKDNSRMAYVQTMLCSVQMRQTPTLEELLKESAITADSLYSHNTNGRSVPQSEFITGTNDCLSLSPPPEMREKNSVPLTPLTSTTNSAFFPPNVTPQQSYQEDCLIDQHHSQQGSKPSSFHGASHQSSGHVTYENFENTASVSGRIDTEKDGDDFCSSEGAYNMGGFFLHNTSNTIAKMPDIISHPPIDGEELEKSGLETSFCNEFLTATDICCSSLQEDLVTCDRLPVEQTDSTEGEDNLPVPATLDLDKDENLDRMEGLLSSSENSRFSGISELSQTWSTHHCTTTEQNIEHNLAETEPESNHVEEDKPSEEPYRLSLQALLKKSQEYRRRQRMLRNQAKNTKIQERTQTQPRVNTEEQGLSDKENDEFSHKDAETAEGKKAKETRGTFIPSVAKSPKKFGVNEKMIERQIFGNNGIFKPDSPNFTRGVNTKDITSDEEEMTFRKNQLNISQEIITQPKQISVSPQQQTMPAETSPIEMAIFTSPTAFHKGGVEYQHFPTSNFCKSPVLCKNKGISLDGEPIAVAKTAQRNVLINTGLNEDQKVEERTLQHQNTKAPSTVSLVVEGGTSITPKPSQHLDQLEYNLSGLKVLISDLEFTLTENFSDQSQTECGAQSNDGNSNDAELNQRCRELQGRQSLDNFKIVQEDPCSEPSKIDKDDVSLIAQLKGTEVINVDELRLVKTLATERGKVKGTCRDGLSKSCGQPGACGKQQLPAKSVLSLAQQLRIPEVLRNIVPESSVLSDASNHPAGIRNATSVESLNSTCSSSLNQSYDVEAPSGLWLVERSGPDSGSRGHLVEENHLTPESGGEGQGSQSKVKRRLLMHGAEETPYRTSDVSKEARAVVRPTSSTPRAVRRHEGHGSPKDKQDQLKEAHAAQIKALQEEHRRQQEELTKALAARYGLHPSASFPCSMSSSCPGDTLTFPTLYQALSSRGVPQASSPLSEQQRPLLAATIRGFLTRRLLRTDRVVQLVRTIKDTRQFLWALQQQSPGRGELLSRQDLLLRERVTLQLRAARYEVHDIFFSLPIRERMQLINWDRDLVREKELKRQSEHTCLARRKSSLSAATQKSLERKKEMMIQKRASGRFGGSFTRTGHNTRLSAGQPLETQRGQFHANPQRVPKSKSSSRPR